MSVLRQRLHEIIDSISDKKIADIVDYLEYIKLKEELEATDEILKDKLIMDSIRRGLDQEKNGEIVSLSEVIEDV